MNFKLQEEESNNYGYSWFKILKEGRYPAIEIRSRDIYLDKDQWKWKVSFNTYNLFEDKKYLGPDLGQEFSNLSDKEKGKELNNKYINIINHYINALNVKYPQYTFSTYRGSKTFLDVTIKLNKYTLYSDEIKELLLQLTKFYDDLKENVFDKIVPKVER